LEQQEERGFAFGFIELLVEVFEFIAKNAVWINGMPKPDQ